MADPQSQPVRLPAQRVADADRELVAARLREAMAEGRLDIEETEDRLTAVYAAKTVADLDVLTSDLPATIDDDLPQLRLRTKSGSVKKNGDWRVPRRISAECTSGSIKIDFTEAECRHQEVEIQVSARSGSIVMVVPAGWAVDMDDVSATSGMVVNKVRGRRAPNAPLLRVSGEVLSGVIRARHPYRSFRDWLWNRRA
jgi:hypothetical protein